MKCEVNLEKVSYEKVMRMNEKMMIRRGGVSFPKISRQFFDYIPTLVDICSRYIDIFLS